MMMPICICTARMVFGVDRLQMQFCGPKTAHYVQLIAAWLAFPSTIRRLQFCALG
jgi:hypothetical protein